ncbi:sulfate ABC transporter substrate-binding protein [soil metagenome]
MRLTIGVLAAFLLTGCDPAPQTVAANGADSLTVSGFAVSRDVYEKGLLPAFEKTHPGLQVHQSYDGSGAQARAIVGGGDSDVAALAMAPEIASLQKAGRVDKGWTEAEGVPAASVVVIAVRPGNPKGIKDFSDLEKPGVQVVSPNPDTSGAARWNILAVYGAAQRSGRDPAQAVTSLRKNIVAYGKSGREAMKQFASGVGDALLTWENEALLRKEGGTELEIVYPAETLRMAPPVAPVGKKGAAPSEVATAFVEFLKTPDAQKIYAKYHYRSADASAGGEFPTVKTFDVKEIGGWEKVGKEVFGPEGVWARAVHG